MAFSLVNLYSNRVLLGSLIKIYKEYIGIILDNVERNVILEIVHGIVKKNILAVFFHNHQF